MDPLHIFTPLAHMQFQPSALRLGWKEFKSKEEKEQKKNKDFALFMILWLCSLAQEPELTSEISSLQRRHLQQSWRSKDQSHEARVLESLDKSRLTRSDQSAEDWSSPSIDAKGIVRSRNRLPATSHIEALHEITWCPDHLHFNLIIVLQDSAAHIACTIVDCRSCTTLDPAHFQ